jgi:hypothetical protein
VANKLRSLLMSWALCGAYAICIGGAPSWIYMEEAVVNGPNQDDMTVVLAGASNDLTQAAPRDHIDGPKVALNHSARAKHLDGVAQVQTLNAAPPTRGAPLASQVITAAKHTFTRIPWPFTSF